MQCLRASYVRMFRSLRVPATLAETPFSDIVSKLASHFTLKPSVTVERFAFHKRGQRPEETVADFVVDLHWLSEHCEFGNTLQDMLGDRLVCGIRD